MKSRPQPWAPRATGHPDVRVPPAARLWAKRLASSVTAGTAGPADAVEDEATDERWPCAPPSLPALHESLLGTHAGAFLVAASAISLTRQGGLPTAAEEVELLLREGYRPRAKVPPVLIKPPVDWQMDPFVDRNWRAQLNMLRIVDPFIRAYEQTREARYLRQAFEYCLDWGKFHQNRKHPAPHAWVDMVVGVRSQRLSYLAERLRAGLFDASASERLRFARLLASHWKRLTAVGFFKYTNHTIVDLHGLMSLVRATILSESDATTWALAIGKQLDEVLARQFNPRGVHLENSPAYQFVAKNMFMALHKSNWYARTSKLGETLARAAAIESWMRLPDGRLVALGDTDGEAPRDEELPALAARTEGPVATIDSINHSGYCFVRSVPSDEPGRWSFLGIKAGFENNFHRHHDDLSYVWSEAGWDIVVDAGKYSYDAHPMRRYATSPRAHSVIEFEGRASNTEPGHRTGHLTRKIETYPWGVRVEAEWSHEPSRIRQRRTFYFSPGRWLIVRDDFEAERAIDFVHRTLVAPEFEVTLAHDAFTAIHRRGARLGIHFASSVALRRSLYQGQTEPSWEGWISRGYRDMQPASTLAMSGNASQGVVIAALSLVEHVTLETDTTGRTVWRAQDLNLVLDT